MIKKVSIIAFYDNGNSILLQGRQKLSQNQVDWGFFGGHIEKGESPEEALIREINEELTYDLKGKKYEYLGEFESVVNGILARRYLYISKLKGTLNDFDQKEGDGMALFSLKDAKKLKMYLGDEIGLKMIENYLNL